MCLLNTSPSKITSPLSSFISFRLCSSFVAIARFRKCCEALSADKCSKTLLSANLSLICISFSVLSSFSSEKMAAWFSSKLAESKEIASANLDCFKVVILEQCFWALAAERKTFSHKASKNTV